MHEQSAAGWESLERAELTISFIPVICAAPLIYAHSHGIFARHGLRVRLAPAPGWSGIKEQLVHGFVDAAHMLCPMPLACSLGIDGQRAPIHLAAIQNTNGQALTLARKHERLTDIRDMRGFTLGVPYRFSMHYYLLADLLARNGVNPLADVVIREVSPARMPYYLEKGWIDGFFAPGPFNQIAVQRGIAFIHALSKDIQPGHPCCCLATSHQFLADYPGTYRAMLSGLLEAQWQLHVADAAQRALVAREISAPEYLDQKDPIPVEQALSGVFPDGRGVEHTVLDRIDFIPHPQHECGCWILAQMQRWAQLPGRVNYRQVVADVFDAAVHELARGTGFSVPDAIPPQAADFGGDDAFAHMRAQPFCAYRDQPPAHTDYALPEPARRRITEIINRMAAVAGGDLERTIGVTGTGEIGVLEQILDETVRNMRFSREALAEQAEKLESWVDERTDELVKEIADRKRAEARLRLEQERLEALLQLNRMAEAPLKEITTFALEAAVRLTESEIGYLAFMNEDESVLTMHAWSNAAMEQCAMIDKPIVYPLETTGLWGEAVRQRKPVLTNDYAEPNPLKKGYPDGHVHIVRHMNVPVFEDEHIVAVAGVGNKRSAYDDTDVRQLTLLMQAMCRLIERKRVEHELRATRDELEQRVQRRTAALAKANEELKLQITEREQTEKTLRDSQALYSSLVENLPVHVLRKERAGHFTFASQSFCDLIGKPLAEILGRTDFDFYPAELARKYRQDDQHVLETGELLEDVEEYRGNGDLRFMRVMKSPVRDAGRNIVGVQVIFWDVTDHKRAEMALEHERYLLHALMDNLPHNIYFKDTDSRFIRINRAMAGSFGLSDAAEAVGRDDSEFFTEEHAEQARADEQAIINSGVPVLDKEEKETWPDGHETWVSTTKLPLYDEQGKIVGTFGISRDITQRKRASVELQQAKEEAEEASRAKSDFLANMSHEIRTPMNAILGMTELVLDTSLTKPQRDYLQLVRESGESLLSIINDILDFSKIEAGRLDLESTPFDVREVFGDTLKSLALRAHAKGLELACRVGKEVPERLMGDVGRLRQIIVNLVGNAIKFTETGEIVADVQRQPDAEHGVVLHFSVADTGIGIPHNQQMTIFDAFEQVDSSTTRRFGGTGLGLTISSRLIRLMDGQIRVESEMGRGSRFHVTIRLQPAPPIGHTPQAPTTVIQGTRVLVVDDNATNRRILEEVLNNWGLAPTVAAGGREALGLLRAARQAGTPFRLVLSDANMPEMDGFRLAEQITADTGQDETIIMMLTSGGRPGDVARCEQLGIAGYILKPIKQSDLFDAMVHALGVNSIDHCDLSAPDARPGQPPRPLRILLAEDSIVNQKLAVGLLEKHGHTVRVAHHGREALAALAAEAFDLVLMDVQMPEMDGYAATAAIRAREQQTGKHIPIVAMTAHAMKGDRERCIDAGMDEYVSKPIRSKQLFDTIEAVLKDQNNKE